MKDKIQFMVYKYTFNDGKVYIGRTRTDQRRLGKDYTYEGQYVHRWMTKMPDYEIDILCITDNIFIAYEQEHLEIERHWENSLNADRGDDWFATALKDAALAKLCFTPMTLKEQIDDYIKSK